MCRRRRHQPRVGVRRGPRGGGRGRGRRRRRRRGRLLAAGARGGRRRRRGRRLEVREGSGVRGVLDLDQDRRADGDLGALGLQEPRDDAFVLRRRNRSSPCRSRSRRSCRPRRSSPLPLRATSGSCRPPSSATAPGGPRPRAPVRERPRARRRPGRWVKARVASARADRCVTGRAHGLRSARKVRISSE